MLVAMKKPAQQDIDTALQLVKLVADPEGTAARLAELMAATDAANRVISEANGKLAEFEARDRVAVRLAESASALEREARVTAERIQAEARAVQDRVERDRKQLEADRAAWKKEADESLAALDAQAAALGKRVSALDERVMAEEVNRMQRDKELTSRAADLDRREVELKEKLARAEAMRGEYERKVASLKAITG